MVMDVENNKRNHRKKTVVAIENLLFVPLHFQIKLLEIINTSIYRKKIKNRGRKYIITTYHQSLFQEVEMVIFDPHPIRFKSNHIGVYIFFYVFAIINLTG
ncbi:hypothetical protein CXK86_01025 [Paenibacillus sp. BGI2013]|nr:hypothetical protein CXK86_01025 [Paenibacillus sp. BGI2013]